QRLGRVDQVEELTSDAAERRLDGQRGELGRFEPHATAAGGGDHRAEQRLLRREARIERGLRGAGALRHEIHRGPGIAELKEGLEGGRQDLLFFWVFPGRELGFGLHWTVPYHFA